MTTADNASLRSAIERLYVVFGNYRPPVHPTYCSHCVKDDEDRVLRLKPLRELNADELSRYSWDAISLWGTVEQFKYLLPRLFETVVFDEHRYCPEVSFKKPRLGGLQEWPGEEQVALNCYCDALWRYALAHHPLSHRLPSLSNLYMRRFALGWKKFGHERRLKAHIVNYADDLVICCRSQAEEALATMRNMMSKLKLTVNDTKTRVCKLPEDKFDFLGYTFGRCYSPKTGRAYLGTTPSKTRVQRICKAISQETGRNKTLLAQETVITTLNRIMIGWANYFCLGPVWKAHSAVERHTCRRLRQWLRAKHKRKGAGIKRYSDQLLHDKFGLVRLNGRTVSFPWAKP